MYKYSRKNFRCLKSKSHVFNQRLKFKKRLVEDIIVQ